MGTSRQGLAVATFKQSQSIPEAFRASGGEGGAGERRQERGSAKGNWPGLAWATCPAGPWGPSSSVQQGGRRPAWKSHGAVASGSQPLRVAWAGLRKAQPGGRWEAPVRVQGPAVRAPRADGPCARRSSPHTRSTQQERRGGREERKKRKAGRGGALQKLAGRGGGCL